MLYLCVLCALFAFSVFSVLYLCVLCALFAFSVFSVLYLYSLCSISCSLCSILSLQVVYKYLFSCVLFVFSVLYLCVLCALFAFSVFSVLYLCSLCSISCSLCSTSCSLCSVQAAGGVQTYASVASYDPPSDHTHHGSPDSHMTQHRDSHEQNSTEDEKPPSTHTVHS